VPTVWSGCAPLLGAYDLSSLRLVLGGGSAISPALSERWRADAGIPITHSWGMTEASPVAVIGGLRSNHADAGEAARIATRAAQGQPVPLVRLRLVGDDGGVQPWDGESAGELQVAGPWIASGYYDEPAADSFTPDGWLRTGDVATIDAQGYVRIVDRVKDMIKSGGEWISSIDLENAITSHEGVAEAAVVAVPDPKWVERPAAYVVRRPGADLTGDDLIDYLRPRVAKWWLPDQVIFLDELPKTGTGKISKASLRQRSGG
jgi:fatty-acyl-CoA synthase